jgi:hypothetical protein
MGVFLAGLTAILGTRLTLRLTVGSHQSTPPQTVRMGRPARQQAFVPTDSPQVRAPGRHPRDNPQTYISVIPGSSAAAPRAT